MMIVRPFGSVVSFTPGGIAGGAGAVFARGLEAAGERAAIVSRCETWASRHPCQRRLGLRRLRLSGHRRLPLLGQEWLLKHFDEAIAAFEVFTTILLRLRQQMILDHVENNFPEVFAAIHAPLIENRQPHRAELLERISANAFQQFLAGHMTNL